MAVDKNENFDTKPKDSRLGRSISPDDIQTESPGRGMEALLGGFKDVSQELTITKNELKATGQELVKFKHTLVEMVSFKVNQPSGDSGGKQASLQEESNKIANQTKEWIISLTEQQRGMRLPYLLEYSGKKTQQGLDFVSNRLLDLAKLTAKNNYTAILGVIPAGLAAITSLTGIAVKWSTKLVGLALRWTPVLWMIGSTIKTLGTSLAVAMGNVLSSAVKTAFNYSFGLLNKTLNGFVNTITGGLFAKKEGGGNTDGTLLAGAKALVRGSLKMFSVVGAFGLAVSLFKGGLGNITAINSAMDVFNKIGSFVKNLSGSATAAPIQGEFDNFLQASQGIYDSVITTIMDLLKSMNILPTITSGMKWFAGFISRVIQYLAKVFEVFWNIWMEQIENYKKLFTGFYEGLSTVFKWAWEGLKEIWSWVSDIWTGIFGSFADTGKTTLETLSGIIATLLNSLFGIVESAVNGLRGVFNGALSMSTSLWKVIGGWLEGFMVKWFGGDSFMAEWMRELQRQEAPQVQELKMPRVTQEQVQGVLGQLGKITGTAFKGLMDIMKIDFSAIKAADPRSAIAGSGVTGNASNSNTLNAASIASQSYNVGQKQLDTLKGIREAINKALEKGLILKV